jgi:molecular chaperone GrpE (heat shock protein)
VESFNYSKLHNNNTGFILFRIFKQKNTEPEILESSFFAELSDDEENNNTPKQLPIENTQLFRENYTQKYKTTRNNICHNLDSNIIKIKETLKRKIEQAKKSDKVYFDLYESLDSILQKMNNIVSKNNKEKIKLQEEQKLPKYGNSMIKLNNKHLGIGQETKNYLRQGSKDGPKNNFIETNSVSINFLDSMKSMILYKRKYFIRMVDIALKTRFINKVI